MLAAAFALVTIAFASRPIPLTADDMNYFEFFERYHDFGNNFLEAISDEPLFKVFSNGLMLLFDPYNCIRILIVLTLVPHFLFAMSLETRRGWIYALCYFTFVELADHMNWIQLRQGFALGLFLLLLRGFKDRYSAISSVFTGLVHSSMVILAPCFALQFLPSRRMAYGIIFAVAATMVLFPGVLWQLTFLFGRRESIYLYHEAYFSYEYILYSLSLVAYTTYFVTDRTNRPQMVNYHALVALVLPMFVLTTFGAFAERLYFIVRWYELYIIVSNKKKNAVQIGVIYLAINLAYTFYYTFRWPGDAGYFDQIRIWLGF